MRGRMNDVKSYVPPFQLGEPMEGGAVGEVVESKAERLRAGRSRACTWAAGATRRSCRRATATKLPDLGADPQQFLGVLGMTGATAYFGLLDAASAKEGDIVFVSAAAGAVGSAVVQIAKAKGMTVIGSAGGEEKCEFVRSLGADQVVDYHAGPILKSLAAAAPRRHRRLFRQCRRRAISTPRLRVARNNARFAICGMIEGYNKTEPTSLPLHHADHRRAHPPAGLHGLRLFQPRMGEFYRDMGGWLAERRGQIARDGRRRAGEMPDAFLGLFEGENTGKMLVRL